MKERKIDKKLRGVEEKLYYTLNRLILIKDIVYFCNLAKKKLQNLNLEEKKKSLKLLIDKIIFYSHKKGNIKRAHTYN